MWANLRSKRKGNPVSETQRDLIQPYFDFDFYELQLSTRQISATDAISHYLIDGWKLGLDPSPYFSTDFYLQQYSDIAIANVNPLQHYLTAGKNEIRETSVTHLLEATEENIQFQRALIDSLFDAEWYATEYPSVQDSGLDPVEHYLRNGWLEELNPSADFSTVEYRSTQMKEGSVSINPLVHFSMFGTERQSCLPPQGVFQDDVDPFMSAPNDSNSNFNPQLPDPSLLGDETVNSEGIDAAQSVEKEDAQVNSYQHIENLRTGLELSTIIGNIDGINDGKVFGWLLAPSEGVIPILFVNERAVTKCDYPVQRPDVNEHLGITGDTGFVFDVGGIEKGSKVELYVLCNGELVHVVSHFSESHSIEENFIIQLEKAHKISQQPGSVAVTCWEGTHNPIGRAKALYDVVSSKRPAIIITYSFDSFDDRIWAPIRGENICILMIPWAERTIYEQAIHSAGIKFDTVWVGKGRFPSFELAKLVSNDDSSIILDFDDNEEHFSKSADAKNKAYGHTTINYSRFLIDKIESRTAASITLKNEFKAHLVRHARFPDLNRTERKSLDVENTGAGFKIKIGFIGTVRQHKNLTDAARAVRSFNWLSNVPAELHVYGDVNPPALLSELEENGVVVKGNIPMSELYNELGEMDVVLTGFPNNHELANAITEYQISSKIGDALSVGRPVLVPDGPSVVDLQDTPGVFLFNAVSFSNKLAEAIVYEGDIVLPDEFTIDGAYEAFSAAENLAIESDSAKNIFSILPDKYLDKPEQPKTLVLLWKQNDSGFYGRRVDQIARTYKKAHPSNRVVILELMSDDTETEFVRLSEHYISEHRLLLDQVSDKRNGKANHDGVEIHQLAFTDGPMASVLMNSFLLENRILPMNSVFIVFPIIQMYQHIEQSIRAFPKIVDVVDNQFYWGSSNQQSYRISQYYMLLRSSESIVFNSDKNREFFVDNDVVSSAANCKVIPNWYELPANYKQEDRRDIDSDSKNIIYSGNMNDRIDWNLLDRITDISENLTVHLVGTVSHSIENLIQLLDKKNVIYHGPLSENDTLRLTQNMDMAIMPHSFDSTSAYMNPLKLKMYQAIGIQTVSTDVPGIEDCDLVTICKSHNEFLNVLSSRLEKSIPRDVHLDPNPNSAKYVDLIVSLMSAKEQTNIVEHALERAA